MKKLTVIHRFRFEARNLDACGIYLGPL